MPIRDIARALNITVDDRRMEEDGLLCPNGLTAYAFLNDCQPEERRRFTLGHELAHWMLISGRADAYLTTAELEALGNEEYFCDKVSAALLMPSTWVESRYRFACHRFDVMRDLAKSAEVSLSAALLRLRDVLGWRRTLLQWTRRDGRWVFAAEAGLFPAQQGHVRTIESTQHVLGTLVATNASPVQLPLLFAGQEIVINSELLVTADRALALVKLPYVEAQEALGRSFRKPAIAGGSCAVPRRQ